MTNDHKKPNSDQSNGKTNEAEDTSIIKAVSHVYGFLPQIAGSIVGLSALAYFIGWRMRSAYYDSLGAPWAKSLLSSTQTIQASVDIWFFIVISFYLAFMYLMEKGEDSIKWLNRISPYLVIGAGLFLIGGFLVKTWVSLSASFSLYFISVILYGCLAGVGIAQLIGLLARERLHWKSYHVHLIYLIIFFGFYIAPGQYGDIRAELDRSPESSSLVKIHSLPAQNEDWRLVTVFGDKALVMRIAEKRKDRAFRIIPTIEIQTVKPHEKKKD